MADYVVWLFDVAFITITGGTFDGESGSNMSGATITLPIGGGWVETTISDDDNEFNEGDITGTGAQRLTEEITLDGVTYPAGTTVEVEYTITLTDGTNTYTVVAINLEGGNGANATVEALVFLGGIPPKGVPLTVIDFSNNPDRTYETIVAPPCFATGSLLATPCGQRRVETLAPGDLVMTLDHGAQQVRWSGHRRVTAREICRGTAVRLAPVRIHRGALGPGLPERDLLVSPQHRILISGWRAELYFGEPEVLVASCHLVDGREITVEPPDRGVTYHHLMFDRHEIVFVEGLPAESFRAGPEAMRLLPEATREEILTLFPELMDYPDGLAPVRPNISRTEAALLRTWRSEPESSENPR